MSLYIGLSAILLATTALVAGLHSGRPKRTSQVPRRQERVLILGASAGIGRALALEYARQGALICVVARRVQLLDLVADECRAQLPSVDKNHIIRLVADFTDPDSLIAVHDELRKAWGGLDTLVVNAGVSALRPILEVAGISNTPTGPDLSSVTADGLRRLAQASSLSIAGNYTGPMLSAVVFIPLLVATSPSPAILLTSSVAALIPAPTRGLYGSSKAASLLLFKALAIEHPQVTFSYMLPATVRGDFRKSAVDGGNSEGAQGGLSPELVALAAISAVDNRRKMVYLPSYCVFLPWLYLIAPKFVDHLARKKYKFRV